MHSWTAGLASVFAAVTMGGCGGNGDDSGGLAARSDFADCVENVALACACDPFDSTSCLLEGTTCSLNVMTNVEGKVVGIPAFDGSDDASATSCFVGVQTQRQGEVCQLYRFQPNGKVVTDTCLAGLFCEPDSLTCVPICTSDSDCSESTCHLFDASNPDITTLGFCTDAPAAGS